MSLERIGKRESPKEENIDLPVRSFITEAFDKTLSSEGLSEQERQEKIGTLNDIVDEYIRENLENTNVFSSEGLGASFPYTTFDNADFARRLYQRYAGELPPHTNNDEEEGAPSTVQKEFAFSAFLRPEAGGTFNPYEEHLHALTVRLPAALQAIKEGKEPEHFEIYALGSPTNVVSEISPEFAKRCSDTSTFESFAALYAEFIATKLPPKGADEKTNVYFFGQSMGGSFAAKTAEHLLKDGLVTQSHEEQKQEHIPHLQVRADIPPALNRSAARMIEVPFGFPLESIYSRVTDPYVNAWGKKEVQFSRSVSAALAEKGIGEHMDADQKSRKGAVIRNIVRDLIKGTPIPDDLKVTKVIGAYDPMTFSLANYIDTMTRRGSGENPSLGENILPSDRENDRVFGVKMGHHHPWLRESEMKRMNIAVESLQNLKQSV